MERLGPNGTADFVPQVVGPSGLFQPSKTWRLTLLFTQPVYDAGQRRALRALRDVTLDQSKLELTDIQIRARSEVRLAQEVVAGSDRALAASRRSADTANEALRITTSAFQVGATYDFEGLGIDGLTFRGSATFGSGAINPDTGAFLTQNTEFDFDLEYKFSAAVWPDWLKPLALHGRAGLVQENLDGRPSSSNEYRLMLNYEVAFKGGRRY